MANLLDNVPSSLSDDQINELVMRLEAVAPSPSIEEFYFDDSGFIAIIAGTLLMSLVFAVTAGCGTFIFFILSRQSWYRQQFTNDDANKFMMNLYLWTVAPSFGILSTTSLNRIDALWGGVAAVW